MPQISVIIPVYNTEEYLKQCIDSVSMMGQQISQYIYVKNTRKNMRISTFLKVNMEVYLMLGTVGSKERREITSCFLIVMIFYSQMC